MYLVKFGTVRQFFLFSASVKCQTPLHEPLVRPIDNAGGKPLVADILLCKGTPDDLLL
jgi:hypothetical protein